MKEKIKPLGENILVKPARQDKKTRTGLYLPETASEDQPQEGRVIEVGDHKDIKVKKGMKVIFRKYAGTEIKIAGEDYIIVKNEDVLAVIG